MDNNDTGESLTINSLPDEIIVLIIQHNNYRDMVRFGSTCKRFNDLVGQHQILWKNEYKRSLPTEMFEVVAEYEDGNWLNEIKQFFLIKKLLYSELKQMSAVFYWQATEVTFQDVKIFLNIALTRKQNYYYVIHILQDLVKKTIRTIDKCRSIKPFTLTEMHYAKVVLRHLLHVHLAIKWVRGHVKEQLPPEMVANFFLQWVDTSHLHPDELVELKLAEVVKNVGELLEINAISQGTIKEKFAQGIFTLEQIVHAISHVIYKQRRMAITTTANLDTLNIAKVLDTKYGNIIIVATIYYAIAVRCGVQCQLVVFPNHLFLEFRKDWNDLNAPTYTVDLNSGDFKPKQRCPFSHNTHNHPYKYYPESLLQSIYSRFHMSMGYIKDWNTQNALHLLDFIGTSHTQVNPYRNYYRYLIEHLKETVIHTPLNMKYMNDVHHKLIISLSNLNSNAQRCQKDIVIQRHEPRIRYAVGMICSHRKMDYTCVIRGWDAQCRAEWADRREMQFNLDHGISQPFYYVVAVDQSTRYVAQENLKDIKRPGRLYHLEDIIAREFTHFDGFCYIPNDEKKYEYPDEDPIASMYRCRAALKN